MTRRNSTPVPKGKARVLTPEELDTVISSFSSEHHASRNLALFYLSFGQGLRVKELSSLSIMDVCHDDGTIRDSFTLAGEQTKEKRARQVYLSNPKLRTALVQYVGERKRNRRYAVMPKSPLFLTNKGSRFSPNSLQQVFKRLYRRAGIDGASSHSGRRTYATRLALMGGADIRLIATSLGHKNLDVTQGYIDYGEDRLKTLAGTVI